MEPKYSGMSADAEVGRIESFYHPRPIAGSASAMVGAGWNDSQLNNTSTNTEVMTEINQYASLLSQLAEELEMTENRISGILAPSPLKEPGVGATPSRATVVASILTENNDRFYRLIQQLRDMRKSIAL